MGDIRRTFGKRVREIRSTRGLSQEKLGHKIRMSRNYIGMVERGERNPTITTASSMARALKVTLSELVRGL